ncbi:GIY-YIG catalytic domain protein [Nocardioidaceae bacterium Broad-1]|nr:GIY-YIG catalytic domain protein [Nocardioidaceae bacterium Broad-1]
MAYTYMLLCADRTLYVGSTTDLERRMSEHRVGLGSEYTRHRLPVQLVWYEQYDNVAHAFDREKQIQNWSRTKRLALIRGQLGDLPRLANTSQTPHPLAPPPQ